MNDIPIYASLVHDFCFNKNSQLSELTLKLFCPDLPDGKQDLNSFINTSSGRCHKTILVEI